MARLQALDDLSEAFLPVQAADQLAQPAGRGGAP